MSGRPWDVQQYEYRNIRTLSECGVLSNSLSLVIPAPDDGEEIFVLGWAGKFGHTGDVPEFSLQLMDGTVVWRENLPAQDTWGYREYGEKGLPIQTLGVEAKVVGQNTELSVAELWLRYQVK